MLTFTEMYLLLISLTLGLNVAYIFRRKPALLTHNELYGARIRSSGDEKKISFFSQSLLQTFQKTFKVEMVQSVTCQTVQQIKHLTKLEIVQSVTYQTVQRIKHLTNLERVQSVTCQIVQQIKHLTKLEIVQSVTYQTVQQIKHLTNLERVQSVTCQTVHRSNILPS